MELVVAETTIDTEQLKKVLGLKHSVPIVVSDTTSSMTSLD